MTGVAGSVKKVGDLPKKLQVGDLLIVEAGVTGVVGPFQPEEQYL